jgi:hypothetical protein
MSISFYVILSLILVLVLVGFLFKLSMDNNKKLKKQVDTLQSTLKLREREKKELLERQESLTSTMNKLQGAKTDEEKNTIVNNLTTDFFKH